MTDLAVLLPFLIFAVVMTGTPGPNNAMVLVCGARSGVLRSIPLVSGIALGVGLQFAVLGLGLGVLFDAVPGFHIALAILGTGYILWLAWKIATSGPLELHQETRPPMGLIGGAAFQWINPKAWTLSISAAATYIPVENHLLNLTIAAALLTTVTIPCVGVWAIAGVALRRVLTRPNLALIFNMGMSITLILATVPAVFRFATQQY
ncbi:LysE family translocator [Pseudomonas hefeiensis]|uniref:LysE family translocator n=1 Tax=Pseudomonas hefeiensis TaxID=2738125 RepID=A0ABY9G5Y0_9PSED|nr:MULTISPECIES: LysE family translocator [unclassified Pseudomonas]WLH10998.1 LysE family translocator [Pseudomonas sp. FP205]WLH94074.1 LysE family translocator [Pseudomonas sp. FP53]WLI38351.1 LysE family translocator [Pseudomonas sp. FP821]